MPTFIAVRVQASAGASAWAVERTEPSGLKTIVSAFFSTHYEAEMEANKLNLEAARSNDLTL